MIKIPFDEKENKKREDGLRKDFLAKAAAQTPEAFADILNEVTVEKVVEKEVIKEVPIEVVKEVEVIKEVDNPKHVAKIEELKKSIGTFTTENADLNIKIDALTKDNEKLRKEIPKLKKAIAALSEPKD